MGTRIKILSGRPAGSQLVSNRGVGNVRNDSRLHYHMRAIVDTSAGRLIPKNGVISHLESARVREKEGIGTGGFPRLK